MMRRLVLITVALSAVVSFGLYRLSYQVQHLERELATLNDQLLAEQEAIQVLRAEWSFLNRPEVLQTLAARHLDLQPIAPGQIAHTIADLPDRVAPDRNGVVPVPRPTGRTRGPVKFVASREEVR